MGVAPELAGIVIGAVIIDYLNEWRQDEQLKEQLVLQMGSKHNDVTDTAIRALSSRGWLNDGSLKGASLVYANLEGADLPIANLQRARLIATHLKGADLRGAKLRGADLGGANLKGANPGGADLEGAQLFDANLRGALSWTVNQFANAKSFGSVNMPDGVKLKGNDNPDGPTFEQWTAMQAESDD